MFPNLINSFFTNLFLTLLIELFVVFLLGYREKPFFIFVVLINIITNPLINYLILVNYRFNIFSSPHLILFLEMVVVLLEWLLLIYSLNSKKYKKLFLLSLIMNFSSFAVGIFLFGL